MIKNYLTACGMFFVLLLLQCTSTRTLADDSPYAGEQVVPLGMVLKLNSAALGEARKLNVYLPQGYHTDSSMTYPVIYLLDGSAHEDYPHIVGLVQFLNLYEILPPAIVVGIANVDRYRDFTHPSNDPIDLQELPTSGGSAAFIDFLADELQPYIDQRFPTNGHRSLIGQSMGGLLATEVLFKRPQLFQDYLLVSPSLWWDQQSMINKASTYLSGIDLGSKRVFISLGQEHPTMHEVADKLAAALRSSGQSELEVIYQPLLAEDHATILHRAVYLGFETLYK
ncbi:MAG: alpha/beta hydrolase-fold protein [Bacteroidota bacterium]